MNKNMNNTAEAKKLVAEYELAQEIAKVPVDAAPADPKHIFKTKVNARIKKLNDTFVKILSPAFKFGRGLARGLRMILNDVFKLTVFAAACCVIATYLSENPDVVAKITDFAQKIFSIF